jgi:hypothetical protein
VLTLLSSLFLFYRCCTRFPALEVGTKFGQELFLPKLLECMNDKDSGVRASADKVLALVWAKKGFKKEDLTAAMEKLSDSAKRTTQVGHLNLECVTCVCACVCVYRSTKIFKKMR